MDENRSHVYPFRRRDIKDIPINYKTVIRGPAVKWDDQPVDVNLKH